MPVKFEKEIDKNGEITLTAQLIGEIDHHSAVEIRECIDSAVKLIKPKGLTLDFSGVTFMDSSGVGLVMGRYKLMNYFGGSVTVKNVSERNEKILRLSGIEKIASIEKSVTRGEAV